MANCELPPPLGSTAVMTCLTCLSGSVLQRLAAGAMRFRNASTSELEKARFEPSAATPMLSLNSNAGSSPRRLRTTSIFCDESHRGISERRCVHFSGSSDLKHSSARQNGVVDTMALGVARSMLHVPQTSDMDIVSNMGTSFLSFRSNILPAALGGGACEQTLAPHARRRWRTEVVSRFQEGAYAEKARILHSKQRDDDLAYQPGIAVGSLFQNCEQSRSKARPCSVGAMEQRGWAYLSGLPRHP